MNSNDIPKYKEYSHEEMKRREELVDEIIELKDTLIKLNAFDPDLMKFSENHAFSKDKFRSTAELEAIVRSLRAQLRSIENPKESDDFII